jgi:hypothetical protein
MGVFASLPDHRAIASGWWASEKTHSGADQRGLKTLDRPDQHSQAFEGGGLALGSNGWGVL